MRLLFWAPRVVYFVTGLLCFISSARATTIEFVSTDLSDVTPGDDLWRYDYTVSGRTFVPSQFFDIQFDPLLYGTLTSGLAPSADWDVTILQQPNPVNLTPFDIGMFNAFALVNNPSLASTFSVTFIYLGAGRPGAQVFEIFDATSNLLEAGLTSPPTAIIPEPAGPMLSLLGLTLFSIKLYRTPRPDATKRQD